MSVVVIVVSVIVNVVIVNVVVVVAIGEWGLRHGWGRRMGGNDGFWSWFARRHI